MKISKFKFFHGKINGFSNFYDEWYRIYHNDIIHDMRILTSNLDINRIVNVINNVMNPNLIIGSRTHEVRVRRR